MVCPGSRSGLAGAQLVLSCTAGFSTVFFPPKAGLTILDLFWKLTFKTSSCFCCPALVTVPAFVRMRGQCRGNEFHASQ